MQPTLYLMCGLPYSGKSTLACKLSRQTGFPIVSIDEVRESLGFYWGKSEASPADWKRIYHAVEEQITRYLGTSTSVIYDSTNHDKASRRRLAELARNWNAQVIVLFVDTPVEVVEDRRESNLRSSERPHIPDHFYAAALASFEAPTAEETVIRAAETTVLP